MDLPSIIARARAELQLAGPSAATASTDDEVASADVRVATDGFSRLMHRLGSRARPASNAIVDAVTAAGIDASATPGSRIRLLDVAHQLLVDGARRGHESLPRGARLTGNRVDLAVGNAEYLPKLYRDLESAREVINITQFNWEPDGSGRRVADILKRKARQGVEVQVLVDAYGISQGGLLRHKRFFDELESAGVHVKRVWSVGTGGYRHAWEHRKVIDVDHAVTWLGGLGFGAKYDGWTDLMVRLDGPAAASAGAQVLGLWSDRGGSLSSRSLAALQRGLHRARSPLTAHPVSAAGRVRGGVSNALHGVQVLENRPGVDLAATESFLRDAASARTRLWVTSPYIGTDVAGRALIAAARRGVDVRLIVPGLASGRNTKLLHVSRTFYRDLIAAGVKVMELPTMLHAKSWVADDVVSVGSMNLSKSSMMDCREVMARMDGPGILEQFERFFTTTSAKSKHLTERDLDSPGLRALGIVRDVTGFEF